MSDALPLQALPPAGRWALLLVGSTMAAAILQWAKLPAAPMLGPLAAAALQQTAGGAVKVPRTLLMGAQMVIGCLIARSITPSIIEGFAGHWPVFLGVVAISMAAGAGIGWAMSRLRVVPGTTAVWGMLPGAATVMMVMAEAYGADFRLVAFMQYLRVVLVAAAASGVAMFFLHGSGASLASGYFPPVDLPNFAATAAIALVGGTLGRFLRIPAGVLLGTLALGAVLNLRGWVRIELPPVVLIASYTLIGWNTGLAFTREVLAAAARAFPQTLGAIALMMAFCGLLAWGLVALLHVDPLTAYLATSPGGVDAAAIIAASTNVDRPFVMALQTVRVVVALILGPYVARWVAGIVKPAAPRAKPVETDEPVYLSEIE